MTVVIGSFITYLAGTFLGYGIHWLLHQPWSGILYKTHMYHHLKLYPPRDVLSEKYRDPGKFNTVPIFTYIENEVLPQANRE